MRVLPAVIVSVFSAAGLLAAETIWRLDNLDRIGGHAVEVLGAPKVREIAGARAVVFDGVKDGVLIPAIPFAVSSKFTLEILFLPEEAGPRQQRFLHVQDTAGRRALIETRLDGKGGWWLDTFIAAGGGGPGLTLVDPKCVHPTGQWYWAALRYDGKTMAHFVDGQKEREGAASFEPFGSGQISLGVRQNRVHWFKGAIREVRFHPEAVSDDKLQRPPKTAGGRK